MKIAKQEVTLVDRMGTDLSVVNAARVSFNKESQLEQARVPTGVLGEWTLRETLSEKDAKLINYLARNNHWTPFGHTSLSFRVKAPIFVARQLGKHQVGLVWNEVSRRYVDDEPEFFLPDKWRSRPEGSVKQGSGTVEVTELAYPQEGPGSEDLWGSFDNKWHPAIHVELHVLNQLELYRWLIKSNVAPEQARMILPQNTMTEWIWTGSLAAWARVCKLRLDPHAQEETREIAHYIAEYCMNLFPVSFEALMK